MSSSFVTTHWSIVLAARDRCSPDSRIALSALCAAYWYPLYAFVRRWGHDADSAQDLTQAFFLQLLEKNSLQAVDQAKGKFRSFLLASVRHFLLNQAKHDHTLKRGGGETIVAFDPTSAEGRYALEPTHDLTAEKLFERRWALTLLDHVLCRLSDQLAQSGKGHVFDKLKSHLLADEGAVRYHETARELHTSEGAIKVMVHRLRKRYRELLREEIARTVENTEQVEEEIRELFAALE